MDSQNTEETEDECGQWGPDWHTSVIMSIQISSSPHERDSGLQMPLRALIQPFIWAVWAVFAALWSGCSTVAWRRCMCVCVSYRLSRDWSNHLWRKQPFLTLYMPDTCSPPSHGPNCSDPASELTLISVNYWAWYEILYSRYQRHSCGILTVKNIQTWKSHIILASETPVTLK